jgi:MFS family permease
MNIKSVKFSFYTISSLYTLSASFIWGVNTLFLLDAGLNILEVFIANAVFTGSMTLFEIPTGVFADTKGRRFSFLASTIVLLLGTLGYVGSSYLNGGLFWFSFFSVILGLGFTFYSGAVEAWVVDELQAVGFTDALDTVFSKSASISGVLMILGTIAGGAMGTFDLRIPFLARAFALGILFIFAFFFMKEKGFTPTPSTKPFLKQMSSITAASIEHGWKKPSLRLFMLISFVLSAFMMWGFYASQPYLLDLLGNRDAVWVSGLVAAAVSLAQIFGNLTVEPLLKMLKKRTTILILAISLAVIFTAGIGLANNFPMALAALLLLMFSFGMFGPVKQAYMHQIIPKEQRATVISFDSLIGNGGGILGQPALGYLSNTVGIGTGYLTGSAFIAMALPFLFKIRSMGEKVDKTKGR